jgi:uncharacterized protein (TIGR03790 family)
VRRFLFATLAVCAAVPAFSGGPENVVVVENDASPLSRIVGEYYVAQRHTPLDNVCHIRAPLTEEIVRAQFDAAIARPLAAFLRAHHLVESILYIVTTAGLPLKIAGSEGLRGDAASVDSELTLLYADLHGIPHRLAGPLRNPFFGRTDVPFRHPDFPLYLVTRLAGYDFPDIRASIDRALRARNTGRFVIDLRTGDSTGGDNWLRSAAAKLPKDRVILDDSTRVLRGIGDVIAYASWGSNDPQRKDRDLGFRFLPGAIVTEFVSSNGRTFARPPDSWTLGNWGDRKTWFAGAPQTLTADYIHQGATGASGNVYEPFLQFTARPDVVLPAYYQGRNLAESFWAGTPALSWMNVVIGDPLCSLGRP